VFLLLPQSGRQDVHEEAPVTFPGVCASSTASGPVHFDYLSIELPDFNTMSEKHDSVRGEGKSP
jgi:hypothetical protein